MTERQFTVLISSAGRRVSLLRSMTEALTAAGLNGRVIACDISELTPAMQLADERFIVPRCTDPEFVPAVTKLCAEQGVDLVIPTIDPELPIWAQLKNALASAGTTVAVSSPAAIAIAGDKQKTNAHCTEIGVPVPRQATLDAVEQARDSWPLPFIVKPRAGSASAGFRMIERWSDFDSIQRGDARSGLIAEERLAGVEHTIDVYVDQAGTVHCPVVRRRLEIRAGEVSKALVVRDDRLATLAMKIVETLPGAYGVLNVQMFADDTSAGVLEINARFGGGYPLTWRAGGRYSEWLIREVAYGETPPIEPSIDHDLAMLRWDEEVFVRV